jgi:hypothetical protein
MNIRNFLLLAALLAAAPAWAFDLKGVEVGQPVNAAQLKTAFDFHFATDAETSELRCVGGSCGWGYTSIAGGGADIMVTIEHHVLAEIVAVFRPIYFDQISDAFIAKYGKPAQTSHAKAQTAAGVQLNVIIETWRDAAGDELVITNFMSGTDGALMLTSKAEVDGKAARAKKHANDI